MVSTPSQLDFKRDTPIMTSLKLFAYQRRVDILENQKRELHVSQAFNSANPIGATKAPFEKLAFRPNCAHITYPFEGGGGTCSFGRNDE